MQFFEAIWKAIGKLDAGVLIVFEKVRKTKLISESSALLLLFWARVWNPWSSSSPLWTNFLRISIANLHALAIKAGTFFESLDYKVSLTTNPLNTEVKPSWMAVRVGLFLKFYLKSVGCYCFNCRNVTTLKIAFESNRIKGDNSTKLGLYSLIASTGFFDA